MILYRYRLDMTPGGGVPLVVHVNQYDEDFSITFSLYTHVGGQSLVLSEGTTAMVQGTKTDGCAYDADATINVTDKTVIVDGDPQMTASPGKNVFELKLIGTADRVLYSANFILDVEPAAMDANSITDESVLKELNAIIESAATATEAAETATEAAESVSESAAQIETNKEDIADLKPRVSANETNISTLHNKIASNYQTYKTYVSGDYAWYDGYLYKCTGATTGTWDSTKWTDVDSMGKELSDLRSTVSTAEENISANTSAITTLTDDVEDLQDTVSAVTDSEAITINKSTGTKMTSYVSTSGAIGANNNCSLVYFPCQAGTEYTISKTLSARFRVGYTNVIPADGNTVSGLIDNSTGTEISITPATGAQYLIIYYYDGANDTATEAEIFASLAVSTVEFTAIDKVARQEISEIVPGLSDEAKTALLACFAHVAWIDEHGQDYYDALEAALSNSSERERLFGAFTAGLGVIRSDHIAAPPHYDDYVAVRKSVPARACISDPIPNQDFVFTVTDSSKYNILAMQVANNTKLQMQSAAYYDDYCYLTTGAASWGASAQATSDYVWIVLKKMDNTEFTTEELANGAEAVFSYTKSGD